MANSFADHPSSDVLERYSLDHLHDSDLAWVEEHLLICHGCQDKLADMDKFIAAMRDGLNEYKDKTLLIRLPEPFDHACSLFELKYEFRAPGVLRRHLPAHSAEP